MTTYQPVKLGLSPDTSFGFMSTIWSMLSSKLSYHSIFSYLSFGQIALPFPSRAWQ